MDDKKTVELTLLERAVLLQALEGLMLTDAEITEMFGVTRAQFDGAVLGLERRIDPFGTVFRKLLGT